MTVEEISIILERVKDLTNDEGKRELTTVIRELASWTGHWLKESIEKQQLPATTTVSAPTLKPVLKGAFRKPTLMKKKQKKVKKPK